MKLDDSGLPLGVALGLAVGVALGLAVAAAMFLTARPSTVPKADYASSENYTPQFKRNDCFISNRMPREPWQPPVDGIITAVGYRHYLVILYEEANKRYGGGKEGWQEEMREFDRQYHIIACPKEWGHREGTKR